jgi:peptidoglycan/LPS O-acetylase OafA/YrhL
VNVRADRFPLFDGLRALAALSVLAFHAAYYAGAGGTDSVVTPYAGRLEIGVSVFFVISGFLLYRPFVKARLRDEPQPKTGAYAWRRFLRIGPGYWVALTVVAVWLDLPDVFTGSGIPTFYGFFQSYSSDTLLGGIGQAWSLCVEVVFYASLPLWAWVMRGLGARGDRQRMVKQELAGLVLLLLISVAYKMWALHQEPASSLRSAPYLLSFPAYLDQFSIGMLLALASVAYEGRRELPGPIRLIRRLPSLPWLCAAVAFWAVSTQIGLTGRLLQHLNSRTVFERHALYSVIALGLVLPAVFVTPARGLPGRVLGNRVVGYVGLVSYGVYLYHDAVIRKLAKAVDPSVHALGSRLALNLALGVIGSVAIASVSYYVVERPALRLKRRFPLASPASAGEAIAEPAPALPPEPATAREPGRDR